MRRKAHVRFGRRGMGKHTPRKRMRCVLSLLQQWHPDGIAWTSAMLQVWPLSVLQAAFPDIDWVHLGCTGGGGNLPPPAETEGEGCVPSGPNWTEDGVGYSRGCGPPLLPPGPDRPEG